MEVTTLSKQQLALLEAYQKGYYIDLNGKAFGPNGELTPQLKNCNGIEYKNFSVKYQGKSRRVPFHRMQAFQKYGEAIFEPGIQVRHLDGNSLNNSYSNIEIGTQSDNMMDRPEEDRVRIAKIAAKHKRKWSDEEIEKIKKMHEIGHTYKQIRAVYPMAKSTLSYILNGKTYPEHMEENCA